MDAQLARALGNPDGPPVGVPRLAVGASIQLRHKPSRIRKILRAEWHYKKQAWTYVVETARKHRRGFEPKFAEDQLLFEGELADPPRDNQTPPPPVTAVKRSWFQRLFGRGPGR
jgi:hypothetical protein